MAPRPNASIQALETAIHKAGKQPVAYTERGSYERPGRRRRVGGGRLRGVATGFGVCVLGIAAYYGVVKPLTGENDPTVLVTQISADGGLRVTKNPFANAPPNQVKIALPKDYTTDDKLFDVVFGQDRTCVSHTPVMGKVALGELQVCFAADDVIKTDDGKGVKEIDAQLVIHNFNSFKGHLREASVAEDPNADDDKYYTDDIIATTALQYISQPNSPLCAPWHATLVKAADMLETQQLAAGQAAITTPDPNAVGIKWLDNEGHVRSDFTCPTG